MATLNVIYRIAADISSLEGQVTRGVTTMSRMEAVAGTVGRALAGAFTITAVTRFVNDTLQAADRLERLADTTGISVEALQDLEYAATQSGNTLDQVTNAITQMQRRLGSGDDGAVGALGRLGLSFETIRSLTPDEQFMAIAAAIAEIEDPLLRADVGSQLFGRSWAQIAPTLRADIRGLADDFEGMSGRATKVLDDLGDKITRWAAIVKAKSGEFVAAILDPVNAHEDAVRRMAAASPFNAPPVPNAPKSAGLDPLISSAREAEEVFTKLNGTLKQQAERMAKVPEANERAKKSAEEMTRHFRTLWDSVDRGGSSLASIGRAINADFDNPLKRAVEDAEFAERHFRQLWDSVDRGGNSLRNIGQSFGQLDDDLVPATTSIWTHLRELFTNVPAKMGEMQDALATSLTGFFGGGGTMHSIMSTGLNLIFGPASGLLVSLAAQGIAAMSGVILDGLKKLGGWFKDFFSWAWDGIKAIFGFGGGIEPVPGVGQGTTQPIPGSPGNEEDLPGLPNFMYGTHGKFVDFGAGTLAMLHGREMVVPEGQAGAGGITIHVHGSVLSERDLLQVVRDGLGGDMNARYRQRAA
jgi:hypothetical protein